MSDFKKSYVEWLRSYKGNNSISVLNYVDELENINEELTNLHIINIKNLCKGCVDEPIDDLSCNYDTCDIIYPIVKLIEKIKQKPIQEVINESL